MLSKNKKSRAMAVAGAVVGAGAVIAGAMAMSNKKNQRTVKKVMAKARDMVDKYSSDMQDRAGDMKVMAMDAHSKMKKHLFTGRKDLKKVATSAIKAAEKVTKVAKKGVKKI